MPADDSAWILERLHEIARTAPAVEHEVEIAIGEPGDELPPQQQEDLQPETKPERAHVRIQWKLATLGHQMNLGVWIARNDKSAVYNDERLGDLSVEELPFSYDSTTQGTIERIDVLWVKRNRIEAAFEIESTTAIYSGLLRMADLLALQPSIDIPLFIVAPDDRRHLVLREIRRPTFTRMETPLHEVCRYVPFSKLEAALEHFGENVKYLRPDFMDSIAERVA
jgi:hypothetical protein